MNIPLEVIKLLALGVALFLAFAWCRTILPRVPGDIHRLRYGAEGAEGRTILLGWLITVLVLVLVAALIGPRLASFVSHFR